MGGIVNRLRGRARPKYSAADLKADLDSGQAIGDLARGHYSKHKNVDPEKLLAHLRELYQGGQSLERFNLSGWGDLTWKRGASAEGVLAQVSALAGPMLLGEAFRREARGQTDAKVAAIFMDPDEFQKLARKVTGPEQQRRLVASLGPIRNDSLQTENIKERADLVWKLQSLNAMGVSPDPFLNVVKAEDRIHLVDSLICLKELGGSTDDFKAFRACLEKTQGSEFQSNFLKLGRTSHLLTWIMKARPGSAWCASREERAVFFRVLEEAADRGVDPISFCQEVGNFLNPIDYRSQAPNLKPQLLEMALFWQGHPDADNVVSVTKRALTNIYEYRLQGELDRLIDLTEHARGNEMLKDRDGQSFPIPLAAILPLFQHHGGIPGLDPSVVKGAIAQLGILQNLREEMGLQGQSWQPLEVLSTFPEPLCNSMFDLAMAQELLPIFREGLPEGTPEDFLRILHMMPVDPFHKRSSLEASLKAYITMARTAQIPERLKELPKLAADLLRDLPRESRLEVMDLYVNGSLSREMLEPLCRCHHWSEGVSFPVVDRDGGLRTYRFPRQQGPSSGWDSYFKGLASIPDKIIACTACGHLLKLCEEGGDGMVFGELLPLLIQVPIDRIATLIGQEDLNATGIMNALLREEGVSDQDLALFPHPLGSRQLGAFMGSLQAMNSDERQAFLQAIGTWLRRDDEGFVEGAEKLLVVGEPRDDRHVFRRAVDPLNDFLGLAGQRLTHEEELVGALFDFGIAMGDRDVEIRDRALEDLVPLIVLEGQRMWVRSELGKIAAITVGEICQAVKVIAERGDVDTYQEQIKLYELLAPHPYRGGIEATKKACAALTEILKDLDMSDEARQIVGTKIQGALHLTSPQELGRPKHPMVVHEALMRKARSHSTIQAFNLEAIRALPWKQYTHEDLAEGINQETLKGLLGPLEALIQDAARAQSLDEQFHPIIGCSVKAAMSTLGLRFIQNLLREGAEGRDPLSPACYQFHQLLDYFQKEAIKNPAKQESGLTAAEEGLIKLGASLASCDKGKTDALERFYDSTFSKQGGVIHEKGLVQDKVAHAIMDSIRHSFRDPELHVALTRRPTDQGSHFSLYMMNRLAPHLGMPHLYEYDVFTHYLPMEVLRSSNQSVLRTFLNQCQFEETLIQSMDAELDADAGGSLGGALREMLTDCCPDGEDINEFLGSCLQLRYEALQAGEGEGLSGLEDGQLVPVNQVWDHDDYDGSFTERIVHLSQRGASLILTHLGYMIRT